MILGSGGAGCPDSGAKALLVPNSSSGKMGTPTRLKRMMFGTGPLGAAGAPLSLASFNPLVASELDAAWSERGVSACVSGAPLGCCMFS